MGPKVTFLGYLIVPGSLEPILNLNDLKLGGTVGDHRSLIVTSVWALSCSLPFFGSPSLVSASIDSSISRYPD